jgi:hypothetical protein
LNGIASCHDIRKTDDDHCKKILDITRDYGLKSVRDVRGTKPRREASELTKKVTQQDKQKGGYDNGANEGEKSGKEQGT